MAEDAGPARKVLHQAGDGVVSRHRVQAGDGRLHLLLVDAAGVAALRNVGRRLLERRFEGRLQLRAAGFPGKLQRTGSVLQDLHRLQPRHFGEEPAAARVHEHRLPLHLQQLERLDPLQSAQVPGRMSGDESRCVLALWIEDHLDELVAREPGVAQEPSRFALVEHRELVAEDVERGAERGAPVLPPSGSSACRAAAVAAPALDSVRAAPGGPVEDLRLVSGREQLQRLRQVHQLDVPALGELADRRSDHLVAALAVVAERLTVDGDR